MFFCFAIFCFCCNLQMVILLSLVSYKECSSNFRNISELNIRDLRFLLEAVTHIKYFCGNEIPNTTAFKMFFFSYRIACLVCLLLKGTESHTVSASFWCNVKYNGQVFFCHFKLHGTKNLIRRWRRDGWWKLCVIMIQDICVTILAFFTRKF